MKHVIVFPVWLLLAAISLLFGSVLWLYRFSMVDFKKGSTFINTKLVRFTSWYEFSK